MCLIWFKLHWMILSCLAQLTVLCVRWKHWHAETSYQWQRNVVSLSDIIIQASFNTILASLGLEKGGTGIKRTSHAQKYSLISSCLICLSADRWWHLLRLSHYVAMPRSKCVMAKFLKYLLFLLTCKGNDWTSNLSFQGCDQILKIVGDERQNF